MPCKWLQNGNNVKVEISTPDGKTAVLTSDDGGESFIGSMNFNNVIMSIWILRDFHSGFPTSINPVILKDILVSDTYNAFCQVEMDGQFLCVPGEFEFDKNGRFALICDSSEVQKMFGNIRGTYELTDDDDLKLKTDAGPVLTGQVWQQGSKIVIPVGNKSGMSLTIYLIR